MSKTLQVSQSAICKIEKRKISPGYVLIRRLCELMDQSLEELIEEAKKDSVKIGRKV